LSVDTIFDTDLGFGHPSIGAFSEQKQSEIVELNVQKDHVHLIAMVPPKLSILDYMGVIKGRTAIRFFNNFRKLKKRPYWGNRQEFKNPYFHRYL